VLKKGFYYREPGGFQEDDLVLVTKRRLVIERWRRLVAVHRWARRVHRRKRR
jgi:hypothetical protein